MKYLLLITIASVVLVGCSKNDKEFLIYGGGKGLIILGIGGLISWMIKEHNDHKK